MTIDSAAYHTAAEHLAQILKDSTRSELDVEWAAEALPRGPAYDALNDWMIPRWLVEAARIRLMIEAWWEEHTDPRQPVAPIALICDLIRELEPHTGTPPGGKDG